MSKKDTRYLDMTDVLGKIPEVKKSLMVICAVLHASEAENMQSMMMFEGQWYKLILEKVDEGNMPHEL